LLVKRFFFLLNEAFAIAFMDLISILHYGMEITLQNHENDNY